MLVARAQAHPRIRMLESHLAVDIVTGSKQGLDDNRALGAYVLHRESGRVQVQRARATVLASGGAGKVYLYTSNPDIATGDGIAMAWRAGCRFANMEFIQFHPTCLYHPKAKSFLVSEALRGEERACCCPTARRSCSDSTPAPSSRQGYRGARHRSRDEAAGHRLRLPGYIPSIGRLIRSHFPTVTARCLSLGFDLTREPIPVVPAAHYVCGGVVSDSEGRTDVDALYAIGEVAFTGLHGANRLASNALLECMVFAESASVSLRAHMGDWPAPPSLAEWMKAGHGL